MIANRTSKLRELARFLPTQDRRLLDQLLEEAVDLIIFGSRAAGVHSKLSDLDILYVGVRERYKSECLDIVWRQPSEIEHRKWLGSELASHIAAYGIVIQGDAHWKDAVRLADATLSKKERRVAALVDGLWVYWDRIHPEFRRKYLTTIRREVQRLQLLREGVAVPRLLCLTANGRMSMALPTAGQNPFGESRRPIAPHEIACYAQLT